MDQTENPRLGPTQKLKYERDRILSDAVFTQSSALVRLLKYLVEKAGSEPAIVPTQYDIATEGMGRPADFDEETDSYVRVLVSRLRKALAQFYSINQATDGMALSIPKGQYGVKLESLKKAYPELMAASVASVPASAPEPMDPARSGRWRLLVGSLAATALAVLAIGALLYHRGNLATQTIENSPLVAIHLIGGEEMNTIPGADRVLESARRLASTSTLARLANNADDADYHLGISVSPDADRQDSSEIFVTMTGPDKSTLLTSRFHYDRDDPKTLAEINGAFIEIFRPSGLLATDLLAKLGSRPPNSAFECYLVLDANTTVSVERNDLDRCVRKFGSDTRFMPNILIRQAFAEYLNDIAQGREVRYSGSGWGIAKNTLAQAPSNLYGNTLVARVDFAENQCARGLATMDQLSGSIESYPALQAMLLVDAWPCREARGDIESARADIRELSELNVNAAPILRAYIILGLVQSDQLDLAREVYAAKRSNENLDERLSVFYRYFGEMLMEEQISSPDLVDEAIRTFVWNRDARATIARRLDKAGQHLQLASSSTATMARN